MPHITFEMRTSCAWQWKCSLTQCACAYFRSTRDRWQNVVSNSAASDGGAGGTGRPGRRPGTADSRAGQRYCTLLHIYSTVRQYSKKWKTSIFAHFFFSTYLSLFSPFVQTPYFPSVLNIFLSIFEPTFVCLLTKTGFLVVLWQAAGSSCLWSALRKSQIWLRLTEENLGLSFPSGPYIKVAMTYETRNKIITLIKYSLVLILIWINFFGPNESPESRSVSEILIRIQYAKRLCLNSKPKTVTIRHFCLTIGSWKNACLTLDSAENQKSVRILMVKKLNSKYCIFLRTRKDTLQNITVWMTTSFGKKIFKVALIIQYYLIFFRNWMGSDNDS